MKVCRRRRRRDVLTPPHYRAVWLEYETVVNSTGAEAPVGSCGVDSRGKVLAIPFVWVVDAPRSTPVRISDAFCNTFLRGRDL
jgi:hypothetical protein